MISELMSALGLSGAAGLNAYIPLLSLAVAGRFGDTVVNPAFDFLTSPAATIIIVVLLIVEVIVDKVPALDSVNDAFNTAVRPAAGGLAAAATATGWWGDRWWTAALLGALVAFGVHGIKSVGRPAVNVSTAGIGGPIVSVIEDVVSLTLSIVAILVPLAIVVVVAVVAWLIHRVRRRRRATRAARSDQTAG